jgi:hypothetical protein
VKLSSEDNQDYVIDGEVPSFHKTMECNNLHSDLVNFKIPAEIKEKGQMRLNDLEIGSHLTETCLKLQMCLVRG